MRVLVIDDEEIVGRALHRILSRDHEVLVCSIAADAVTRIRAGERFDAILCDVVMPTMSGADVYEAVATIDREQARRIVFMSGRVQDVESRIGKIPCVAKPFDLPALREVVGRFLPIRLHDSGVLTPRDRPATR